MALSAEGTIVVARTPREVLELVLDLDRYRLADRKFGRIVSLERRGNRGVVRYSGRLRGLPTPVDTQEIELVPWSRLTFRSVPSRWPGSIAAFEGLFTCEETAQGTSVLHRESFTFARPLAPLAEAFLGRWFGEEMRRELARLAEMLR
jgi:hypothetical protein